MDESTPQQSSPLSKREEELDKAFVAERIDQPNQPDKLARGLLVLSFVVPVIYVIVIKFFSGTEVSSSGIWLIVTSFLSCFISLLLSLFALFFGKGKQDIKSKSRQAGKRGKPESVESLYMSSARYKRRMLGVMEYQGECDLRVIRGGSWNNNIGFRLVFVP